MAGKLISVSGIDGCGKSTLAGWVHGYLQQRGLEVVRTSALSDNCTPICRRISDILKDPDLPERLPYDAEMALLLAARVITEKNVIEPALSRGAWVVSDRYRLCAKIYQKGADGNRIHPFVCESRLLSFGLNRLPDLEAVIDIDPQHPHKAFDPKGNRLESRSMEEWKEMRLFYQRSVLEEKNTIGLNGYLTTEKNFGIIRKYIDRMLEGKDPFAYHTFTKGIGK